MTAARVALFFTLLFSYPVLLHPTRSAINRLSFFLLEIWNRRKASFKVCQPSQTACIFKLSFFDSGDVMNAIVCCLIMCPFVCGCSIKAWRNQERQSSLLVAGATNTASTHGEMSGGCFRELHQWGLQCTIILPFFCKTFSTKQKYPKNLFKSVIFFYCEKLSDG